ncbi:MAG: AAA family ATPase [Pseudomonadota bacterium]
MSIAAFLASIGFQQYRAHFEKHAIDEDVLAELTSEDLLTIGVEPLGHRKKILAAISDRLKEDHAEEATDDAHQRNVAVLFADLVDSTTISQRLAPEALRDFTSAHQAISKNAVEHYGGKVAQFLGDGVLAFFGFPRAHEDDVQRAALASLEYLNGLEELQNLYGSELDAPVRARIGLECGPIVIGSSLAPDSGAVGETLNLASRLHSLAAPNEIIVGPQARQLLPETIRLDALGEQSLKGFDAPVPAWRVSKRTELTANNEHRRGRPRGVFVGREAELGVLSKALASVRAGSPACVHVVGEPGIGKSRLIDEFLCSAPLSTRVLVGHCAPHGAAALHPFAGMLKRRAALGAERSGIPKLSALHLELDGLGGELSADAPYLVRLAGFQVDQGAIDTDTIRARTQMALRNWIGRLGRILPTIVFVNDTHWSDELTEELLGQLAKSAPPGVLLLYSYRVGHGVPWARQEHEEVLPLEPLENEDCERLFESCFTQGTAPVFSADIAERSAGNPLFIEELAAQAKAADDRTSIALDKGGPLAVPSTLSGLLLQRVDLLSAKAQALLRTASAIGRRFWIEIAEVPGPSRNLAMSEILGSGLLIAEESSAGVYRFKHALVQEAIYESMLSSVRRRIHAKVAHRLEDAFNGREQDVAEDLARHFELADAPNSASRYGFVAGEKALALFALRDAARWIDLGLSLLPSELTPEEERERLRAISNRIQISCWDAQFGEMVEMADRELDRIRQLDEKYDLSRMLSWLGEAYLHDQRYVESRDILVEAAELGDQISDDRCVAHASAIRLWLRTITDRAEDHVSFDEEVLRLEGFGEDQRDRLIATFAKYAACVNACDKGLLKDAAENAASLLEFGAETGYPPAICWGGCLAAYIEALHGNSSKALRHCEAAENAAQCAFDRLVVQLARAVVLERSGDSQAALDLLERVGRRVTEVGAFYLGHISIVARGRALRSIGKCEEAVNELSYVVSRFDQWGHAKGKAAAMFALAEACADLDEASAKATGLLEEAAEIARVFGMRGLLAEVYLSSAIKHRTRGDQAAAARLIEEAQAAARGLGWLSLEQKINAAAAGFSSARSDR